MSSGRSFGRILRGPLHAAVWAGSVLLLVSTAHAQPAVPPQPPPAQSPPAQPQPPAAQPAPTDGAQPAPPAPPAVDPEATRRLEQRIGELETRLSASERAAAQPATPGAKADPEPGQAVPQPEAAGPTAAFDGYIETYYSYNLNRPRNGITNFRGFDNRHQTFTLSNAVLGGTFDYESLSGRLALQIGHTPTTYYLAEPVSPGAGGAATTDGSVFKYIQTAYVGWKAPVGTGLMLQAGVFVSPIGFEGIAVKDNWNWSRSDLFFGLPFYHTGIQAKYDVTESVTAMLMVSNGWNSVVDNNLWKSITTQWIYKAVPDMLTVSVLYFGGVERPSGSPEGEPWRHLFDLWTQLDATKWLSFALQADAGLERTTFGTSWWATGALYGRVQPASWLYLAARGDVFREEAASSAEGAAARIFWPADWVGSGTFTADLRPHDNLSFRLEYRHDAASSDMFFEGRVEGDGAATPFVPNASSQNTITAGATGWF